MQLRRLISPESVVEGEKDKEVADGGVDGGGEENEKGEEAGPGKRKASSRIQSVKRRKVGGQGQSQGHEESEEVLPSGYRHDVRTFLASLFRCVFFSLFSALFLFSVLKHLIPFSLPVCCLVVVVNIVVNIVAD